MSTISKKDALALAADIRRANISAHAITRRVYGGPGLSDAAFVGALEIVIGHFVAARVADHSEVRAALVAAFNYRPTQADIDEREARLLKVGQS